MHTAGWITQDKPNSDAQLYIDVSSTYSSLLAQVGPPTSGALTSGQWGFSTIPTAALGDIPSYAFSGVVDPIDFVIQNLLQRLGILNTSNFATNRSQEAFGTAAAIPGPSAVAGTSSPSGFGPNQIVAPVSAANLATLKGSVPGSIPKGVQINYVDVIYAILGNVAATVIASLSGIIFPVGLNQTPLNDDNNVITDYAFTTPQKAITTTDKISRIRIPVTNPTMLTADIDTLLFTLSLNNLGACLFNLVGIVLGVSYNFN